MARPTRIQQGTWCPICSQGKTERLARKAIERVFNKEFPSTWPKFLNGLQLDCYNEELGIALEYQGEQHFKYVKYFHGSVKEFKKQLERDKRKKELCEENDIFLIYLTHKDSIGDFEHIIIEKLKD